MPQWKTLLDGVLAVPEKVYETFHNNGGWDNDTEFGRQFGENGVAWCAIFDWCMYSNVGLANVVPKTDNVGTFSSWAQKHGQWSEFPSIGAWVNFSNGGHTELVIGFDQNNVITKGGNSLQSGAVDNGQGNGVFSHNSPRRAAKIVGYFAPRFPDGVCPPTADPSDPRGAAAVASWRHGDPIPPQNDGGQQRPAGRPAQPAAPRLMEADMASGQIPLGFGADAGGTVNDPSKTTVIFLNGPGGGGIGDVFNYFFCDHGRAKLRVAFNGPNGWRIEQVIVDNKGHVVPCHPQKGESHASVCRMPMTDGDTAGADIPIGWGTNVFAS